MAIEVFNRHEKKYMLDVDIFSKIQMRLADYMELDVYNKNNDYYTITNLYYDTADDELIRHSISKPVFKEKLRMRGYGIPSLDSKVYIEIKKKVTGIVNKRRSAMKLKEAYGFLQSGTAPLYEPYMNQQVLREIESFLTQYKLKPAVYLAYDRIAYFGKGNRDLRMSFDFNIRSRRSELMLEAGDHGQLLLGKEKVLMEIKTGNSMPLWLVRILSEHKVYPSSFSKYGAEYIQMASAQMNRSEKVIETPLAIASGETMIKRVY
ncbi:polyphosphate polymerase domain-containing protein [Metabacillus fastidiosus]|uniref:polyphosphate polymerase domain-containing protein n=1 Tax=Metabacillus fastidiosus TaxID=1458 RepID=UPI002DBABD36|nr:polyphosphate polymerase domain-containing protein [Metabacillus fastidiosus]MEC2076319.1 polyphosphate polymerase domain-containing protein [Metabacillus fastidiosus]